MYFMDEKYSALFTPWKIGNVEIKNRIVQCSMGGTSLFGWLEPCHFDKEAANFLLNRAQEELAAIRQGNYPAIKTSVEDFGNYDIVFVGYPIWYGSMGTPMQTFLHNHASKLAGKRIALFASSGSSGISASVDEVRTLCSGATFTETLLLT